MSYSESVSSAASAHLQVALLAVIDPFRHTLVTHLTFMAAAETSKVGMLAIVAPS